MTCREVIRWKITASYYQLCTLPAIKVIEDRLSVGSTWRAGVPVFLSLEIDGQNDADREETDHEEKPNEVDLEAEVLDGIRAGRG